MQYTEMLTIIIQYFNMKFEMKFSWDMITFIFLFTDLSARDSQNFFDQRYVYFSQLTLQSIYRKLLKT